MIRKIVVCVALALVVAATNRVALGQDQEGEAATNSLADGNRVAATSPPDVGASVTPNSRRFGPLYEAGRAAPPTDDGWPADWDERPHLSIEMFGATRDFDATHEYRNSPSAYGDRQFARPPYGQHGFGNGPYGQHGFGNGPYGPQGFGIGPYGPQGYGPYSPRGYGNGAENRSLSSSDSGFVLRYGDPGQGTALGAASPWLGYPGPGPAYGLYPPSLGYGAYGAYPPHYGYGPSFGPGYWGGGLMPAPPGGYGPYFGW